MKIEAKILERILQLYSNVVSQYPTKSVQGEDN